jgi:hypothetical protein
MRRQAIPVYTLLFVTVTAFGIAVVLGSAFGALAALLVGFVSLFVMAIAWMRPSGYPTEHHPKIDRIFDDTAP